MGKASKVPDVLRWLDERGRNSASFGSHADAYEIAAQKLREAMEADAALSSSPPAETEEGNSSVGIKPSPTDENGGGAEKREQIERIIRERAKCSFGADATMRYGAWVSDASEAAETILQLFAPAGCQDPNHDAFPVYGVAPHEYFRNGITGRRQTVLLPRSEWPDNFVLDVQPGEDPDALDYPNACGTYFCPTCKEGSDSARVAQQARTTADSSLSAEGCSEVAEGEPSQPTEPILSLFSPQSLKASEKKEDHSPRAVPLSTISEGWRPIETAPIGEYVLLRVPGRPALVCIQHPETPGHWESYDAPLDWLRDLPTGWAPVPSDAPSIMAAPPLSQRGERDA